jgi:hypothetical protein
MNIFIFSNRKMFEINSKIPLNSKKTSQYYEERKGNHN